MDFVGNLLLFTAVGILQIHQEVIAMVRVAPFF